jgi:hypothetical protein
VTAEGEEPERARRGFRSAVSWALALVALAAVVVAVPGLRRSFADPGRARPDPGPAAEHLRFVDDFEVRSFLRGNLHAHSRRSDGDSPPQVVFSWYRDHGYAFAALTDHNKLLHQDRYRAMERPGFVIIPGEEITMAAEGKPVHVNALCTEHTIGGGKGFADRAEALQWAIAEVRAQGGVALVNHPNFDWALDFRHVNEARGAQLFDIYNGHPNVANEGDDKHPSTERLWEALLTAGSTMAPAAVDDVHAFTPEPPKGIPLARPGMGWVEVFGEDAGRRAICEALAAGRLYASNGARLEGIRVHDDLMSVWVSEPGARVDFLGEAHVVLGHAVPVADGSRGWLASYRLGSDERFVRARVTGSDGRHAWTNAYRTRAE